MRFDAEFGNIFNRTDFAIGQELQCRKLGTIILNAISAFDSVWLEVHLLGIMVPGSVRGKRRAWSNR